MPDLKRCPRSQIDDEALEMVSWWVDWKMFGCFPYGSDDVNHEPGIVYSVICFCDQIATKANSEKQEREMEKIDA